MKSTAARGVLSVGVLYLIVGLLFGQFAGQGALDPGRVAWRWGAWVVSAIAFGAHIIYEQLRLRTSPRITAFHVSSAAGLGAFGLAVAANVHSQIIAPDRHSLLLVLSLAIWPILTALPAFVVALLSATLLARLRRIG